MVGVSKKLYSGVVKYLTDSADKLREGGKTEDDDKVLQIIEAVLETLDSPAKDDFERMLNLAIVSETIKEASATLLVMSKYGLAENVEAGIFVYGTIIGVCNVTMLQAGVTTEKVKAYVEEQADSVVMVEETVA